jgi:hypothetical protein
LVHLPAYPFLRVSTRSPSLAEGPTASVTHLLRLPSRLHIPRHQLNVALPYSAPDRLQISPKDRGFNGSAAYRTPSTLLVWMAGRTEASPSPRRASTLRPPAEGEKGADDAKLDHRY